MLKNEKLNLTIKYFLIVIILFSNISCESKKEKRKIIVNTESKYIYDFTNLLSSNELNKLNLLLERITLKKTNNIEYVFCSVRNEKRKNINTVSNFYFKSLDVGKNDYKNRVLIIISIVTRDFKIAIGENIKNLISEKELKKINKDIIKFFKKSKFYDGLNFAFTELDEKLSNQPNN